VYPNSADYFQILSPEFTARYFMVSVTITDPQDDTYTYLQKLVIYVYERT